MNCGTGVPLTTSARVAKGSGVTSPQMDAAEAVKLLRGSQALAQVLIDAARQQ